MASADVRKRALQSFMSTPQSMDACCNLLHLNIGSQVHKDIVRAIVQITGYGKQHVKPDGLLEPRRVLADGTLSTKFNDPFKNMVGHFLEKLKAGVLFFPVHLPDHAGWDTSFWTDDRLEWRSLVERDDIRGGILLMFEHIKNNGVTIDLKGAEVRSFFYHFRASLRTDSPLHTDCTVPALTLSLYLFESEHFTILTLLFYSLKSEHWLIFDFRHIKALPRKTVVCIFSNYFLLCLCPASCCTFGYL